MQQALREQAAMASAAGSAKGAKAGSRASMRALLREACATQEALEGLEPLMNVR